MYNSELGRWDESDPDLLRAADKYWRKQATLYLNAGLRLVSHEEWDQLKSSQSALAESVLVCVPNTHPLLASDICCQHYTSTNASDFAVGGVSLTGYRYRGLATGRI
jgi:hypothetical protein